MADITKDVKSQWVLLTNGTILEVRNVNTWRFDHDEGTIELWYEDDEGTEYDPVFEEYFVRAEFRAETVAGVFHQMPRIVR